MSYNTGQGQFPYPRQHDHSTTLKGGPISGATITGGALTSPTITTPTVIGSGGQLTLPAGPDTLVGRATTDTLTNKTLTSPTLNTPTVNGSGGTLTLPVGPDTLVGRATVDTLTNKTLTSPTIATPTFSGALTFQTPHFQGVNTSGPSIPNATWTTVAYTVFSQVSFSYASGTHVTAPVTGSYRVSAGVYWTANATGTRGIMIRKNSGGLITGGVGVATDGRLAVTAGGSDVNTACNCGNRITLTAGDYVELFVYQNSGAGLTIASTDPMGLHLELELVSI